MLVTAFCPNSLPKYSPIRGDYVVHSSHGIGVFEGIHKLDLHGVIKDYIKVRYAKNDTLYVPVTQLDLVSKYIGPREDSTVKLNRLGGTEWQKAKTRVRKAVRDMAKELIALYAARGFCGDHQLISIGLKFCSQNAAEILFCTTIDRGGPRRNIGYFQ